MRESSPPPQGDREAPTCSALIFDSPCTTPTAASIVYRARRRTACCRPGMDIRMMATGADIQDRGGRLPAPERHDPCRVHSARARSAISRPPSRPWRDTRVGDTVTGVEDPCSRGSARATKAVQPDGLLRRLPGRRQRNTGDLRDALEKLKLNDASMSYHAGKLHRPRLRLPLRLFGPAAHGDHHGAPGARIQPRPHHDRAERRLPHHEDERRDASRSIPR